MKQLTPAQKLAQKENWARLQLKGADGNLCKLMQDGFLTSQQYNTISSIITTAHREIVSTQLARRKEKEKK